MNRAEADLIARRTIARYRAGVDGKDREALAAVFADDAVLHRAGGSIEGKEAILGFYSDYFPTVGHARHFIGTTLTEPDGDRIVASSVFSFLHVLADGVRFGWGDYDHVIVPTGDDDGEIVEKTITVHATQVVPMAVAARLLPGAGGRG